MTARALTALLCLVALVVPAAAEAAAPKSAQRFADAALRWRAAVKAQAPALDRAFAALETPRCAAALKRQPPEGSAEQALLYLGAGVSRPIVDIALEPLRRLVADLDAIPTSDPVLRSGRAAWRANLAISEAWPKLDRPCETLERWSEAKWAEDAAPDFDVKAFTDLVRRDQRLNAKVDRAAKRLRGLGVPRAAAKRFSSAPLEDPALERVVRNHLGFMVDGLVSESSGTSESPPTKPAGD